MCCQGLDPSHTGELMLARCPTTPPFLSQDNVYQEGCVLAAEIQLGNPWHNFRATLPAAQPEEEAA